MAERVQTEPGIERRPSRPSPGKEPKPHRNERWSRRGPLLPALVYVVLLTQLPFAVTLFYSFQEWSLYRPDERGFAGLANYLFVFTSEGFLTAAWNTVRLTVSAVLLSLLIGLGLAMLLNRSFRGRAVARTLLITPFLILPVASALLWSNMMLNPVFGIANFVLGPLVGQVDWVAQYPMASIVAVVTRQWTPFMMLILLAGLQSQDLSTMEAARVDGARETQIFRHLTVPLPLHGAWNPARLYFYRPDLRSDLHDHPGRAG